MYTVYLIKSVKREWYYVGMTSNVIERIKRHNKGKVSSTKPHSPFTFIYSKQFVTRQEARKFEKYLKISSSKEKYIKKFGK